MYSQVRRLSCIKAHHIRFCSRVNPRACPRRRCVVYDDLALRGALRKAGIVPDKRRSSLVVWVARIGRLSNRYGGLAMVSVAVLRNLPDVAHRKHGVISDIEQFRALFVKM